jgi:PIN domain nuclease of toxin-antitoxin system
MRVLVDTHIFIWCDGRPNAVASALMAVLRDTRNEIFVSVASIWEIAIKRAIGKLEFAAPIGDVVDKLGFDLLPITAAHAEHAGGLPRHHGDPFDRLLIAQAVIEGLVLGTQDRRMRPYGVATLGLDLTGA